VWQFDYVIGVYAWFPYRDPGNCYELRQIHLLGVCVIKVSAQFIQKIILSLNKIKNKLINCQIIYLCLQYTNKRTILIVYYSTLQLLHVSTYVRHHQGAFFYVSC
jgi:hypothetical protein